MTDPLETGRSRIRPAALALFVAAGLALFAALGPASEAGAASTVTIYNNKLNTDDKRAQVTRYNRDGSCSKSSKPTAIRVKVGKGTRECFMRVPVVGKNVEVSAIGRLFEATPKAIRGRTYLALSVRQSGNGARYQLAVFPATKKFQLRKVLPDGTIKYFEVGRAGKAIKGIGKANRMSLRVFNGVGPAPKSTARMVASVNGKRLAFADDTEGSSLTGTATTFSVGSPKPAKGALASFTSLIARIPDPFG